MTGLITAAAAEAEKANWSAGQPGIPRDTRSPRCESVVRTREGGRRRKPRQSGDDARPSAKVRSFSRRHRRRRRRPIFAHKRRRDSLARSLALPRVTRVKLFGNIARLDAVRQRAAESETMCPLPKIINVLAPHDKGRISYFPAGLEPGMRGASRSH